MILERVRSEDSGQVHSLCIFSWLQRISRLVAYMYLLQPECGEVWTRIIRSNFAEMELCTCPIDHERITLNFMTSGIARDLALTDLAINCCLYSRNKVAEATGLPRLYIVSFEPHVPRVDVRRTSDSPSLVYTVLLIFVNRCESLRSMEWRQMNPLLIIIPLQAGNLSHLGPGS